MKNFIIILALCLFPETGNGEVINNLVLHFNKEDFIFKNDKNGQLYISSYSQPVTYHTDYQAPALPLIRINYLIGDSESYNNVSYNAKDEMISTGIVVAPNPKLKQTNAIHAFERDTSITNYKKNIYPEHNIQYTGTHIIGGFRYVSFLVCPFTYDALHKKLYLKKEMALMIETTSLASSLGGKSDPSYDVFRDLSMLPTLKSLIVNNEDISKLYNISDELSAVENGLRSSSMDYEYLIITNNALKSSFQRLAEWKTIKGIRSKVVTTEEISTQYTGSTLQSKIKKALKDYYNGSYSGLKYALLGGDINVVPSRMCHIECHVGDTVYTNTTPTDMFYACFDGNFEWDANGNGIYGELNDNVDLAPEIVVTRVPVSTPSEVSSFVNRIVNYEKDPIMSNWQKKLLMGGHGLFFWIYNHYCDSEIKADSLYRFRIQPYWTGERTKLFNTYSGDSAYIFNPSGLQEKISEGFAFIDITTHGMPTYWCMRESDIYNITNAQNLNNSGRTVITTVACNTNAFDESISLSEAFIRNSNSGILGYLGCSREGWNTVWPWSLGPSFDYNGEFYEELFTNIHKKFGKTITDAKTQFIGSCSSYDSGYRWLMFGLNPIGDPEMPVYIDTPQKFDNLSISYSSGILSLTTGVSGCTICISSAADFGESKYNVYDNVSGANLSGINADCYLCVTKQGYIPFIARIGNSVFLQNEEIFTNLPVFSTNTYVGSNVNSSMTQGPVLIQKGKVTNKSTGSIIIKNDFEVKSGAELEIIQP